MATNDDGGAGYCARLDGQGIYPRDVGLDGLPAGTYFVKVQGASNAYPFDFRLAYQTAGERPPAHE